MRHFALGDSAMKPLLLKTYTATSCIGKGTAATLRSLLERRSGLSIPSLDLGRNNGPDYRGRDMASS